VSPQDFAFLVYDFQAAALAKAAALRHLFRSYQKNRMVVRLCPQPRCVRGCFFTKGVIRGPTSTSENNVAGWRLQTFGKTWGREVSRPSLTGRKHNVSGLFYTRSKLVLHHSSRISWIAGKLVVV
jgi:hypothetical protein